MIDPTNEVCELNINGRIYVSVTCVAEELRVTRDYVARLAHRKILDGRIVAGAWYVDRDAVQKAIQWRDRDGSTKP
jgi:hypothetical protein